MSSPTPNQVESNTTKDKIIKDIRNLFRLKRKTNAIKDKIVRDRRTLFDSEDYYEPARIGNAFSNDYIE